MTDNPRIEYLPMITADEPPRPAVPPVGAIMPVLVTDADGNETDTGLRVRVTAVTPTADGFDLTMERAHG